MHREFNVIAESGGFTDPGRHSAIIQFMLSK
jgi:hypothetical protein